MGLRMFWRNQQIDMAEDAATRFIQDKIAQRLVLRNEPRLLPDGGPRRGCNAPHNDVSDFAFGMAVYDMVGF